MAMCEGIGLSRVECERIYSVFQLYPEIKTVVLYGSRAKGNFRPNSDIDLTIVETSPNRPQSLNQCQS